MATRNLDMEGVTNGVAEVQISDEEEVEGFILPTQEMVQPSIDLRWALVGRFLTARFIRLNEMSQVMAMNWRPDKGVFIQEIAPQLFLFQFNHEADVKRISEGGSWAYDNHVLLFQRVHPGEDPENLKLDRVSMWVQIHDVPVGFMSDCVAQGIAKKLGVFIESNPNNYSGPWRKFLRIRVSMDVNLPLKSKLNIKVEGGQWKALRIMYER